MSALSDVPSARGQILGLVPKSGARDGGQSGDVCNSADHSDRAAGHRARAGNVWESASTAGFGHTKPSERNISGSRHSHRRMELHFVSRLCEFPYGLTSRKYQEGLPVASKATKRLIEVLWHEWISGILSLLGMEDADSR